MYFEFRISNFVLYTVTMPSAHPITAVIGAQWGDEGKGKLIDLLTENFDVVLRACGGANAGHTIVVKGKKHVFRLLPSGSLHEHVQVYLGSGMVIHLPTLLEEIQILKDAGIDIIPRLHISAHAHVVFEYHKEIDGVLEDWRSKGKTGAIGTTRRGIGPAYADKALRTGLRMEILGWSAENVKEGLEAASARVERMYGVKADIALETKSVTTTAALLKDQLVMNGPWHLHQWMTAGEKMLLEGAQATQLDIDHGTYPYVTSSQTTLAGALQGLGLAPKHIGDCIGVAKAYCTRVGSGTFLTEADEAASQRLRDRGGEYGSVTKRPRRCGWLYIPDLKHSAMINGFACWNITKLDVLDTEEMIPVGIGLNNDDTVIWKNFPGWKTSTAGITDWKKLPKEAQELVLFIEKQTGIPVKYLGTGQGREEMITR